MPTHSVAPEVPTESVATQRPVAVSRAHVDSSWVGGSAGRMSGSRVHSGLIDTRQTVASAKRRYFSGRRSMTYCFGSISSS